jgi:serpin B
MNSLIFNRFLSLGMAMVLLGVLLAGCAPSATATPAVLPPTFSPPETTPTSQPTKAPAVIPPLADIAQSSLKRDTAPDVPAVDLQELVAGDSAFALDFYQAVHDQPGNLFFSPHSLSLALAMTYAGARGETASQFAQTLHFNLPQDRLHPAYNALALQLASRSEGTPKIDQGRQFQLNVANSIWGQQGFNFLPEFLDVLALNYGSGLRLADFVQAPEAARQAINDWVSQQTHDKIKDLVPAGAINAATRLVLANAIYFQAGWLHPFDEKMTKDGAFTLLDGSQVNVPMMSLDQPVNFPYAQGNGYQAIELPYVGQTEAMDVLIPDAGKFADFEAGLNADQLANVLAGLQSQSVSLQMPKFTFSSSFGLSGVLKGMGMPLAFDPSQADFSGMDGKRDLYISDVIHKAFVSVDEQGTEAAAATAVIVGLTSLPNEQVHLTIDRPFIFVIRDLPTGEILFVGRVVNPEG